MFLRLRFWSGIWVQRTNYWDQFPSSLEEEEDVEPDEEELGLGNMGTESIIFNCWLYLLGILSNHLRVNLGRDVRAFRKHRSKEVGEQKFCVTAMENSRLMTT